MPPIRETTVLRLLEEGSGLPAGERAAWLATLRQPPEVLARLRALLLEQDVAEDFLAAPAELPAEAAASALIPGIGDQLGAWELLRPLGSGGMGVVFLARRADGNYEQLAALKLMRGEFLLLDAGERQALAARFDNERRVLARLQHPNIARILDGGATAAGMPWLAMEYVDGSALTDYCDAHGLDVAARVRLFCKVCDGVQAAHRHLIVHRDLKPENILVGADGEPRLLDFGIARAIDSASIAGSTRTGTGVMTPAYASPEQARMEPLTTASDVYSLGVVLYELLAGTRPYRLDGLSPAQSERVICTSQPGPLRQAVGSGALPEPERHVRRTQIGGDLERVVAKAMHKEPDRRYGSAQALAEDLRRCLAGQPVQAHPDSMGYRAARFVGRHRFGSAAAALAFVAVVVAAGVALAQARHAARAAADTALVNAFLLDVLNISSPYASGSEISLSRAVDEAAVMIDQRFAQRPDLAVDVRNALAQSMYTRGRLDAAEAEATRARADAERLFGADDLRTIQAASILANVRKEQERDDESLALFEDSIARLERSGQTAAPLYADLLNDLGVLYLVNEDWARARDSLQRALQYGADTGEREQRDERARTLASLAQAERGLGNYERADALYRQAQPVLEALYPEGGPHLAVILNNRAKLARLRGDLAASLDLQKQAVAMQRRSFSGDHAMVLVPLTNLARTALDAGDTALARRSAEDAVAMAARLYPGGSAHRVNALVTLGLSRLADGRRDEAATSLDAAQTVFDALDAAPASTRQYLHDFRHAFCAAAGEPATARRCDAEASGGAAAAGSAATSSQPDAGNT